MTNAAVRHLEPFADPWDKLIASCDYEPLRTHAARVATWPPAAVPWFEGAGILRELPLDTAEFCRGCPESPLCDVHWRELPGRDEPTPWVCCPECGLYEVPRESLRNWAIDFPALLEWLA